MCDPVTLTAISVGVASASAGMGVAGQMQKNGEARAAFNIQNKQTNLGIQQQEASDSLKAQDTQKQMLQASSTARQSAGETGTSGNSVDALVNDYHATEGQYMSNLSTQQQWDRGQADLQKAGQRAQARERMVAPGAAYLGAALRVAGTGLDSYTNNFARPRNNTP